MVKSLANAPVSALMVMPETVVVGAVVSSTYTVLPVLLPVLPARSVTLKTMLLLPDKVAPVQLMALPLAMLVIVVQVLPPSTEPYKMSPVLSAALSVALMVCAAVCVVKSVALVPVSALNTTPLTVSVGAVVSTT